MLHGSGPGATGWANFSRNIDPLVEAGYRVLLLDCPGWGKSDAIVNSGSRSDLNARILKSVVDQLGIDKVHLLGNSMGGHSAVAFTLSWPERVAKLVLMGGGTGGMSLFTPMPTEGIKLLNALYREPTIENLKKMMSIFVFDTRDSPRRCSRRVSTICRRAATIWTTSSRASKPTRSSFLTLARGWAKSARQL